MIKTPLLAPNILFRSEHDCVSYLFKKRWPQGFICPFCKLRQPEVRPAHTVVCRYCRKQSSITAHTVMHGSRNSLISWMLVAWQFCIRRQGISAREIQRLLSLSSYQTAWRWLQKIRQAAAIAESAPCSGTVILDIEPLYEGADERGGGVVMALEVDPVQEKYYRVRLHRLLSNNRDELEEAIHRLVLETSQLFLPEYLPFSDEFFGYSKQQASRIQLEMLSLVRQDITSWLSMIYRKTIDTCYLQSYLDEFAFHFNTAIWSDRLAVFDHLLSGLLATAMNSSNMGQDCSGSEA